MSVCVLCVDRGGNGSCESCVDGLLSLNCGKLANYLNTVAEDEGGGVTRPCCHDDTRTV